MQVRHFLIYVLILYIRKNALIKKHFDANEPLNHPIKKSIRYNVFRTLYPHFGYKYSLFFALPDKILAMKIKYYLKHNK